MYIGGYMTSWRKIFQRYGRTYSYIQYCRRKNITPFSSNDLKFPCSEGYYGVNMDCGLGIHQEGGGPIYVYMLLRAIVQ